MFLKINVFSIYFEKRSLSSWLYQIFTYICVVKTLYVIWYTLYLNKCSGNKYIKTLPLLNIHQVYIFWLDCESHRYGLNCSFDCGHCKDGKPCSTETGNCFDGCEDEWTGKLCDIGIYHTYFYQKTAHTCISNPTHLNIIIIVCFYYITIFFFYKRV